jgi:diguanylate cyclase (GGDEF)-like protein/putative nucleotidyltransferase with HDIG domain
VASIADLVEDRTVDGVFAVARKRRLTTRNGKAYLALELVDASGRIEGRIWDDVELLDRRFEEGDAVRVLPRVERFDGRLQLQVRTVEPSEADPAELAPAMRRDADELDGFLEFLAAELAHPGLAAVVGGVLDDREVREGLRHLPAAGADGHHGYAGGLLEHTVGVTTLCRETAQLHQRLRSDLLLSAALLHDVGRVRELGRGPAFRPTPEGALLGHVQLGVRLVDERAQELDATLRAELLHAIATHHDRGVLTKAEFSAKISTEVGSVLDLLAKASQDHSDYKQTLSSASGELEGTRLAEGGIKALVNKMIGATRAMETRTQELEGKLQTSSQEIAELRDRLEATQQDTIRDHLTGIPNRRAFDTELKSSIEATRESAEPLSLVMFDVDHFKQFNDTWGHQTGDQVLRLVANCIADNARHSDTTTRFGGEEFAVIMPATALADAIHWANQICGIVRSKRLIKKSTGGKLGVVTISAGVVKHKPGETDFQLVRRADTCLYAAKHAGRDRAVSETDSAILTKAEIEAA